MAAPALLVHSKHGRERRPKRAPWPVRSALREATGGIHERLHRAEPFGALARGELGRAAYVELLSTFSIFHATVSASLGLDEDRRTRLARDLEYLGGQEQPPIAWLPPASTAGRLGSAYVVEGSSLGGKIIYRQLDYLFGAMPDGRRFFQGTPSDTERWRSLCQRIEAVGRGDEAREEMIAGASSTFALFERLIEPVKP